MHERLLWGIAVGLFFAGAACTQRSDVPDVDAAFPPIDAAASDGAAGECSTDRECRDRIACSVDHCVAGACAHDACPDCCPDGLVCDPSLGCVTAPEPCTTDADCRDAVRCTLDSCRDGTFCAHAPQDGLCARGEICLPAVGCIPAPPATCSVAEDCEVGARCVGEWDCQDEFGCVFVSVVDCDDGDACTADACDEERGGCVHDPIDADGDLHVSEACGGDDCDDADAARHGGAIEACGDGVDQDCDAIVDEGCCTVGPCTTGCGSTGTIECPGGACVAPAEACNGIDDDCDGVADDGFACVAGTSASCPTICGSTGTRACLGDCSLDACAPPPETCNGVDDDCDGACDDGFVCCRGSTRDCTALGFHAGTATCQADCGGWTTTGCTNCGNGTIDAGEQCDGASLGGATCTSIGMGFGSGTLACAAGCRYDTSRCSRCGNGTIDAGEQCDGTNLGGATCSTVSSSFSGGTLRCSPTCAYDTGMCRTADASGIYSVSPAPAYTCAFGLVNFNLATLTFADGGTSMTVNGAPCSMIGTSPRATGSFDVSCTLPGSCNETYRLTGTYTGPDTWTGTFSATFTGSCFGCTTQSWGPITGRR